MNNKIDIVEQMFWKQIDAPVYRAGEVIWERIELQKELEGINYIERQKGHLFQLWVNTALCILMHYPHLKLTWPVIEVTDKYIDLKSELINNS